MTKALRRFTTRDTARERESELLLVVHYTAARKQHGATQCLGAALLQQRAPRSSVCVIRLASERSNQPVSHRQSCSSSSSSGGGSTD